MVETDAILRVGAVVAVVVSKSFDTWPLHAFAQALPRDRAVLSRSMASRCIAT
eukprot:CAMPEP_0204199668 /NCGR_PEP_ID=MMETSP0361-20130328/66176_1 /ASSEMBLY_ACC=CAM_ASM_000343 /TAXON_ID=268821 /ORGANISM="Scrippsiella Hangoei, Strain SHTV-5" /LENGTH=52 /DNA_ID=CAMNT_0051161995 /DNA_START=39 /DNA_END=193 /DNA_ORIENTATION=-